jgi:succinate-semialdehyde dehydrogenase/glutarate-semialdehyde dehydrogenase
MRHKDHYQAKGLFFAGQWQQGEGKDRIQVVSPSTEEVLGEIPQATSADIAAAIDSACAGLKSMRKLTAWERSALLRKAAALVRERARSIAVLAAEETGKPITQALGEANAAAEAIDWYADEARRIFGLSYESRIPGDRYLVHFDPVGVVATFTPWNMPVLLLSRKLAPALAAGCAVISRPSNEAAGCTMALVQCFIDAGFPVGAVNVLTGHPDIIAHDLLADSRVAKMSFTGSVPVGKQLIAQAAQTVKRVTMELGGHAPVIVHEDADIDAFVTAAVQAKFRNAGQICASPTRFYIHRSILDKVVAGMAERTNALRVGDPLRDDTEMGPMTTRKRRTSVEQLVDDAVGAGAKLIAGGSQPKGMEKGFFYSPTILTEVPLSARAMVEEPFGPMALINGFESVDHVIEQSNSLPFGLAAYVYTRSLKLAHRTTDQLQAGVIGVNTFTASTAETPFGGMKESGFGREGGPFAIRDYLESKFINLSMPA